MKRALMASPAQKRSERSKGRVAPFLRLRNREEPETAAAAFRDPQLTIGRLNDSVRGAERVIRGVDRREKLAVAAVDAHLVERGQAEGDAAIAKDAEVR